MPWKGRSPREHPAIRQLNSLAWPRGTLERGEAQKPRPVGPARRFGGRWTDGRNGTWVLPGGNARDTFREGKAPKGESHERCRRETKPARARREETAKRVTKPWRRNQAGRGKPASSGPPDPNVLKGAKVHERSWLTAVDQLGFVGRNSRGRSSSKRGLGRLF